MFPGNNSELWSLFMPTQNTSLITLSAGIAEIAKHAAPSIVALRDRGRWFSGFHWRPDVIATASELVRAKRSERIAVVTAAQERIEGTVIGQIPRQMSR